MADLFTLAGILALVHGFFGLVFLVSFSGCIAVLLNFAKRSLKTLKMFVRGMTISIWVTSFSGLITYIFYRAPGTESARSRILAGDFPWLHNVVFEFKEHVGMFPPVIMLVATVFVWHYGDSVFTDKKTRNMLLGLLTLSFLITLLVFGLGAMVTKVESV